jgi:hypothetical protein
MQTESLRFQPSPLEQNALSEILHLRPGETTELDPATIDALILRLCSHHLNIEPSVEGGTHGGSATGSLHRQELEAVERMLKEMVRASEREGEEREEDGEGRGRRHGRGKTVRPYSHFSFGVYGLVATLVKRFNYRPKGAGFDPCLDAQLERLTIFPCEIINIC